MHRLAPLLVAACGFFACADDTPAGGEGDATLREAAAPFDAARDVGDAGPRADAADGCEAVLDDVLLTCGAIVCHDPFSGGIGLSLDLSQRDALPESLFGWAASDDCGGVPYLNAEQPEQSLLILKLDDDPPCGDRMPAGDRPPLDATQRTCFVEWVVEAAGRAPVSSTDDGGSVGAR